MTGGPGTAVVVVGAINVDLVVAADRLPGPGETVVGPGLERHGGGKGANAAVAAARAGAAVRLVGAVGADDTGRAALAELRAEGVEVGEVAVLDGAPTGVALIVVDSAGENQIAVGAGANAHVHADAVRAALARALPGAGCVLVSTEIPGPAVAAAVEVARAAGVRCVLNPAPVIPVVAELLTHGPLLTPNMGELTDLAAAAGVSVPEPAGSATAASHEVGERELGRVRAIIGKTGAPVVVTLGGDGALVVAPDGRAEHVPPWPTTVRDTTGAGDTFNGVLAARLAEGDDLAPAVRVANVAAGLSVARVGARAGMPTAAAIRDALPR
ncbi:ribokinase [Pseudonocardia aurantiaca]|uniref:Ribokinase n=1 Tax=Pseudonocardia aurantiaca TaxID=75290 RepID=A0ABW4FUQ5_9PSEU